MNLATFRSVRPEFATAEDTLAQQALDDAAEQLDEDIYGSKYDHAHGLLAAHLLAMSPYGHSLRLEDGEADTSIYWPDFERIKRAVTPRVIVL